jgi:hypothetical protein
MQNVNGRVLAARDPLKISSSVEKPLRLAVPDQLRVKTYAAQVIRERNSFGAAVHATMLGTAHTKLTKPESKDGLKPRSMRTAELFF